MELETYTIFLMTSAVVVLSPGASAVLVASQGAGQGYRTAAFNILGLVLATTTYFILSATGLAALLLASHTLFQVVKWIGVAYLMYLGAMALLSSSAGFAVRTVGKRKSKKGLIAQGFLVEFANPKALLFFAAILPQFLTTSYPILPQMMIMGATGVIMQFVIYSCYAMIGAMLARNGPNSWAVNLTNKIAGIALIFAAIKMVGVEAER